MPISLVSLLAGAALAQWSSETDAMLDRFSKLDTVAGHVEILDKRNESGLSAGFDLVLNGQHIIMPDDGQDSGEFFAAFPFEGPVRLVVLKYSTPMNWCPYQFQVLEFHAPRTLIASPIIGSCNKDPYIEFQGDFVQLLFLSGPRESQIESFEDPHEAWVYGDGKLRPAKLDRLPLQDRFLPAGGAPVEIPPAISADTVAGRFSIDQTERSDDKSYVVTTPTEEMRPEVRGSDRSDRIVAALPRKGPARVLVLREPWDRSLCPSGYGYRVVQASATETIQWWKGDTWNWWMSDAFGNCAEARIDEVDGAIRLSFTTSPWAYPEVWTAGSTKLGELSVRHLLPDPRE